jgi:hypothetical protein
MRRYLGLAIVVAAIALGFGLWARSGVIPTSAETARSSSGISPYEMMSGAKDLPVQHVQDPL